MTYYLTYQIKGIEGTFVIPIRQEDNVKYISHQIKKEFGIIPNLTARIYGSELQSTKVLSQCVRSQDVVTFDVKNSSGDKNKKELKLYRQPIIIPRYTTKITNGNATFMVFTTFDYKSMTAGDKIQVNVEKDTIEKISEKIKDMLKKVHKVKDNQLKSMKIQLFLPGGVPFLKGNIKDFIDSFENFMPHLYAIITYSKEITDQILDETFDNVCNINNKNLKLLLSPDYDSQIDGLCEIAAVLGYIQQNGLHTKRMIYSIAKFCPFAPMICGLYNLSLLSRVNGRTILQITVPLLQLFTQMATNFPDNSNIFSSTVKFMTYFMNIKISDRVPCTEFIRPFYNIGFERYFYNRFNEKDFPKIDSIIAFDPDFRDQDWIRFELPSLEDEDFENALKNTKTLDIIPPMSLREMHRCSIFRGKNGPWLFLSESVSKEETERDKIDYINPENGFIEHDTYENISVKCINANYKNKSEEKKFDDLIVDSIDPEKVTQLVFIVIDKSGSMCSHFGDGLNRFQASQKFFIKFAKTCYRFHTTSLYGSILFNHTTIVRNNLNPLVSNFVERMIAAGDYPDGGTAMFTAMKRGADLLLEKNQGNKFPNAVLRLIVISDGYDGCGKQEQASVSNYLLQNKIRVDAVIVSSQIARELVAISRYTGGIAIFPRTVNDGLELFNKEEFYNVNLREFGSFSQPNITAQTLQALPRLTENDLDKGMKIKTNEYANTNKLVTSPLYAIAEYDNALKEQQEGKGSSPLLQVHVNQKRIIYELRKINTSKLNDVIVYPLKDRIDIWRVLLRGEDGTLYANKWFYMIIEFQAEYPQHYPLFRFIDPPFHPNITDQGRVCIDTLDQSYKSDMSIVELIGDIKLLLMMPNFDSCVDLKRESMKNNRALFEQTVQEWNNKNGKDSAEDWIAQWKIQPDGDLVKNMEVKNAVVVPEQYICPITRKIMKEPVKASTGIYYEKSALIKYISTTPNAVCKVAKEQSGKPKEFLKDEISKLQIDNGMQKKIRKWVEENDYREDEEEADEAENIAFFINSGKSIQNAKLVKMFKDGSMPEPSNEKSSVSTSSINRPPARPRPLLSEK